MCPTVLGMAILAGRHPLGAERGRITLRTSRDGLAAQAGHDLTLEAPAWSGELVVAADLTPTGLEVSVDLGALVVRSGTGGLKPLTERDMGDIITNARKLLRTDQYPNATYTATGFQPGAEGGGTINGTLTLAGQSRPQQLAVTQTSPGHYRVTTTVRQTDFGIKPYSAFLGSLRVADAVQVTADVDLSEAQDSAQAA